MVKLLATENTMIKIKKKNKKATGRDKMFCLFLFLFLGPLTDLKTYRPTGIPEDRLDYLTFSKH